MLNCVCVCVRACMFIHLVGMYVRMYVCAYTVHTQFCKTSIVNGPLLIWIIHVLFSLSYM